MIIDINNKSLSTENDDFWITLKKMIFEQNMMKHNDLLTKCNEAS